MADSIISVPSNSNDSLLGGGGIGALLIGALLFGGGRGFGGFGGWGGGVGSPAAAAVATDITLTPAFQSLQQQIATLSNQTAADSMQAVITGQFNNTNNAINQHLNALDNIRTEVATGNFTTLNSINGLGRDVTAQANQNALQQLNSFNNLTTTTLTGFNTLGIQTVNSTNQIISQGTALAAQLSSCCCDIQKDISADGDETRALINNLNVQNLRDQLAAANNKVSNNDQNQYLLQTILSHLSPHREREVVA
jgi:hypothetical protein